LNRFGIVASKAADASWRAVQKIENYDTKPLIATRQREVDLPYREPDEREICLAKDLLNRTRQEREAINSRTTSVATRVIEYAKPEHPRTEPVLIQAFRIGDQAIVSMPFEVLVEIGLEIKKKSPFEHTFLIELANGGYGYLPRPTSINWADMKPGWGPPAFSLSHPKFLSNTCLKCSGT
jgi:hypothetical protein